jgi:hypothetical protein
MNGAFDVRTTPRFDRLLKKLANQHPQDASWTFAQALAILENDPYNRTRRHPIKKLEAVTPGETIPPQAAPLAVSLRHLE